MRAEQSDVNTKMLVRGNRTEINLDHLTQNVQTINKLIAASSRMMAVVKGDAYGHGLIPISRHLNALGVQHFAVSSMNDAVALRKAGIFGQILHIGVVEYARFDDLFEYEITPSICSIEFAQRLSEASVSHKKQIAVHVRMDQGLGTVGIAELACEGFVRQIQQLIGLQIEGLYTQIPAAYQNNVERVREAIERFVQIGLALKQNGLSKLRLHAASSPMIATFPEAHFDFVRVGIVLFGLKCIGFEAIPLKAVMQLKSHVVQTRILKVGEHYGYECIRNEGQDRQVATVQIGYGDALFLFGLQQGDVLIQGHRLPIIGRCTMDHLLVDISLLENVQVGDEVVLIGIQDQEVITAEAVAVKAGFNEYNAECVTMFGANVSRFYYKGGVEIGE